MDCRPLFVILPCWSGSVSLNSLAVRRVLGLPPLPFLAPYGDLVEERGRAFHVPEHVRFKGFLLGKGDAPPLRAPCDRPGPMESRERFRAPGKDELRDLADIEGLDRFLEPRDMGRRNLRDLRPLGPPGHREFRAYGEEVILDLRQDVTNSPFALGSNREADDRVELIDAAHRFDPRVIFRDTSRSEQARVARVASARVELRH